MYVQDTIPLRINTNSREYHIVWECLDVEYKWVLKVRIKRFFFRAGCTKAVQIVSAQLLVMRRDFNFSTFILIVLSQNERI